MLFYTGSDGRGMVLKLTYKQRNERNTTNIFGFGPMWECNWLSYMQDDQTYHRTPTQYVPNGGTRNLQVNSHFYGNGMRVTTDGQSTYTSEMADGGGSGGGSGAGGSVGHSVPFSFDVGVTYLFMSHQTRGDNKTNFFTCTNLNNTMLLKSVTDIDGIQKEKGSEMTIDMFSWF